MLDNIHVPKTGISGHATRFVSTSLTPEEKEKIQLVKGCPINKGFPTKLSRASFRIACLKFQKHAGVTSRKDKSKPILKSRSTPAGWRSNWTYICPECKIGKKVRQNKPFDPPNKIEFIDLVPPKIKRSKKGMHRHATQKLTEKEVKQIRQMHQDGYTIADILIVFSKMSRTAISNIVNRVTWKYI